MSRHLNTTAEKLKIGLVLDDGLDSTDGVQQYVLTIGRWLAGRGHEIYYLVGETKRHDLKNMHSLSRNIRVRFNGNRLSVPLPASKRAIKAATDLKLDILHVQAPYSPLMAGKLINSAAKSTAVLSTFHIAPYGLLASYGARLLGRISKRSAQRIDKMLAVSKPAARMAKEIYGQSPEVLGNCFNYRLFANAKPFKKDSSIINILFLGRLVKRKGCQTLLSALALIERSTNGMPDYHLTIAGTGPLRQQLESFVRENNLSNKVSFVGYIDEDDKPSYYASADIAVFPSISGESFGFVLIEAMANGRTAVIAANNPGYGSVLEARPDMLFDAGDEISLASKLKEYCYDLKLREELAAAGQLISSSFDQDLHGQRLEETYYLALRKRRP